MELVNSHSLLKLMVAGLPECDERDILCKAAFGLLKRNLWSPYVRDNLVQAQYYRVCHNLDQELMNRILKISKDI